MTGDSFTQGLGFDLVTMERYFAFHEVELLVEKEESKNAKP